MNLARFFRVALVLSAGPLFSAEWTPEVEASRGGQTLVTYRAKLEGDYLVVQLKAAEGWHTYAMDNKQRATEVLAGKMSLGVEESTELAVSDGLEVIGPWYQSEPKDFSQPKLRWFTWGFDEPALLAAKVKRSGAGPATVTINAQVCDSASCQAVKTELQIPIAGSAPKTDFDIQLLTLVRTD